MEEKMSADDRVRIGKKQLGEYLFAIAYKLKQGFGAVKLLAFGQNIQKAVMIANLAKLMGMEQEPVQSITENVSFRNARGETVSRKVDGVLIVLKRKQSI